MGKKQFNAALLSGIGDGCCTRHIHSILADRADVGEELGYCYPGYDWILARTHCSKRTIGRAIEELRERGHLIVQPRWFSGKLTNHYLVTTGLNDMEIKTTLVTVFGLSAEEAEEVVKKVRARQAGKRLDTDKKLELLEKQTGKMSKRNAKRGSFFGSKKTKCPTAPDILSDQIDNLSKPTDILSDQIDKMSGYPREDPREDPKEDPKTEREERPPSLSIFEKSENSHKEDQGQKSSNVSAKKETSANSKKRRKSARDANPTPPVPPPPPAPAGELDGFQQAVQAVCKKERVSRKDRKRIKDMWDTGASLEDLIAFQAWWAVEYAWASSPPHVSQIQQHMDQARAWFKQEGEQVAVNAPKNEYEYAAQAAVAPIPTAEKKRPKVFRSRSF